MKNKMNKTMKFLSMAALALVGAVMTGCSNDDIMDIDQPGNDNVERLTVVANLDGSTTRALTNEGVKTYAVGDKIAVVYKNTSGNTVKAESDALTDGDITGSGKSAKFTVTLTNPDKNVNVTYIYPAAMAKENGTVNYDALYKEQDGTLATLGKKFDYCTYTDNWNDGKLPAATLVNHLFVCEFTLKYSDASINDKVSAMTISDDVDHNYYVNVDRTSSEADDPIYVAIIPTDDNDINYTAIANGKVYTKSVTNKTYAAGTMRPIYLNMVQNNDLVPGLFSIGASKKAYFSKGNLQLKAANTWAFATNQWECFGTSQSDNHRDLFGWGTGNNPNQTSASASYSSFTDWGNNPNLQSQLGTGWRTLTQAEWAYLFGTNSGDKRSGSTIGATSNARYTEATINTNGTSVNGVIFFPDGATIAASEATTWGTINGKSAWGTKCTTAQWSALEAKGCVFLPAAGFRNVSTVRNVGSNGDYWSSTANGTSNAYYVYFSSGDLVVGGNVVRSRGYSVRLVRPVE